MFRDEGLGLDVVSGGEIGYALSAGFPAGRIGFAGNNKSAEELTLALDSKIGHIVVDNFHELEMLGQIAAKKKMKPDILLRISPGVDPHTHQKISTGNIDSKFGIPMMLAEKAVSMMMTMPSVNPVGLHFHIGSQLTEIEPYLQSIEYFLRFASDMKRKNGFELKELSVGGGYAIQYTLEAPAPPISYYAEMLTLKLSKNAKN